MLVYVRCYESTATMDVQEQLWLVLQSKGWMSAGPIQGINYYYIPEWLESWCLIIDSKLKRHPDRDWIL